MKPFLRYALLFAGVLGMLPGVMTAQNHTSAAAAWLAKAPLAPGFTLPATREAWETRRLEVRAQIQQLLGQLPPRPARPAATLLKREDRGGYVVEKFEFDNEAGARVPGYLLLPKQAGPAPAILYCHWHGGEYAIGKEELFQSAHTPEAPGPALARRGYVVLGIDAYCFGERSGQGPDGPGQTGGSEEMSASKFNLWVGRSLWGMILRDDLMALDYLCTRPEVDAQRIGVTGISMGATRTWWLMALDERLKSGVAVACLTRYQDLIQQQFLHAHGIYYFVPNLLNHFDTEAIISLIAPRPALFMTGGQDGGSPVSGIHVIDRVARQAYQLYNQPAALENLVYPGVGHAYTPDMWARMLAWMGKTLRPGIQ